MKFNKEKLIRILRKPWLFLGLMALFCALDLLSEYAVSTTYFNAGRFVPAVTFTPEMPISPSSCRPFKLSS